MAGCISYSRKVFIPLTQLCRDVCHYCTFAEPPRARRAGLPVARARCWRSPAPGAAAGCKEALFTLGDKPELRYRAAREALAALGYATTIDYLARDVRAGAARDRPAAARQPRRHDARRDRAAAHGRRSVDGHHAGERSASGCASAAARISARPTSVPAVRLATIAAAGELRVPFTTGILIGIGETREERIEALLAMRDLHARTATPGSHRPELPRQARHPHGRARRSPIVDELLWTIAVARLILGPAMNIQAPPNLRAGVYRAADRGRHQRLGRRLAGDARSRQSGSAVAAARRAGASARARAGKRAGRAAGDLSAPTSRDPTRWLDAGARARACCALSDAEGCARDDDWAPGHG